MNRSRQFIRGVTSSWLATLATVVYALLSVPIALRYLTVDEFGLFVLLLQVAAYFTLIEIGMSAATARILVDYKDDLNSGNYGSVILTGFCVFATQALVVLTGGILAAPWIVALIGVPQPLSEVATLLLRWLAVTSALSLAFRMYGSVLYANKRLDLIHAFMGGNILFALAVLTIILSSGGGLAGLVWLFLAQTSVAILLPLFACHKLGILPSKGCWGQPSMEKFRELFGFGKDVFLVNVGNQVLEASQLIIVTRTMGLTAAAIWSVSTKLFTLVYQVITKIEGTAIVFFAEMMVRGEKDKLATRFRQIYQLTAGIAVVALAVVVSINQHFVSAWAKPSLAWSVPLSALLGVCVLLNALTRCSTDLIVFTKNIAAFRYVYFVEAVVFFILALSLSSRFGFYGVLGPSLLCLVLFRGTYTVWRMGRYFKLPAKTFCWTWLKRPLIAALVLSPFVLSAEWLANAVPNPWAQVLVASAWVGLPAAITFFLVALPRDVREEFTQCWQQLSFFGKR
jgi:O-antigen/teichoic acid export membrane protein